MGKIIKGSAETQAINNLNPTLTELHQLKMVKRENVLRELLSQNEAVILFTKADGTQRNLRCTTDESKIPVEFHPKGTGKAQAKGLINAFDLENNGWRSFHVASVEKVTML